MSMTDDLTLGGYLIEKAVPLPPAGTGLGRYSVWAEMLTKVSHGDSIVVNEERLKSLRSHIYRVHRKEKFNVISRKLSDDKFRVWFVEQS